MRMPIPAGWRSVEEDSALIAIGRPPDERGVWSSLTVSVELLGAREPLEVMLPAGLRGGMEWRDVQHGTCAVGTLECKRMAYAYTDNDRDAMAVETKVVRVGAYGVKLRCLSQEPQFAEALRLCDQVIDGLVVEHGR